MEKITEYMHAHVYFDATTRAKAEAFQQRLREGLGSQVKVYRLIDHPIGPHPKPMFEVNFNGVDFPTVVEFMERERTGLDILVHPVVADEVWAHSLGAHWLGEKQPIHLQYLQDFLDGKIPEVGSAIRGE